MATLAKEIFLSYSRQEALKPFVVRVKRDLEAQGLTVWLDIEDIPEGSDGNAATGMALHSCSCLLAVLSNCYISSKYSTSELYVADADGKRIVPLVFETVDYQQSQKAMGVKYVIGGLETYSFLSDVNDYSVSISRLASALKQISKSEKQDLSTQLSSLKIGDVQPSAPPPPPSAPPPPPSVLPPPPPQYCDLYPERQESIDSIKEPLNGVKNQFHVGMKLEANDRRFPYYVCVATIADVRGDEVKIHFDGWGEEYDYWCSHDMIELHPVGWCARNGYEMQKPRGIPFSNWNKYLSDNHAEPCDTPMFNEIQNSPPGSLNFRVGMSLEAKDRKYPSLTCVATITDINEKGELLIHFDGWSNEYNYWCEPDSTDIHPPMWCGKHHRELQPPNNYGGMFRWNRYLAHPDINPAPAHVFTEAQLANI